MHKLHTSTSSVYFHWKKRMAQGSASAKAGKVSSFNCTFGGELWIETFENLSCLYARRWFG